jgi:PIN domain nuclease of toxin-antitoxin system
MSGARFPAVGRQIIDSEPVVNVCPASAYEMAGKYRLGRLFEIGDPGSRLPALMAHPGFLSLAVMQDNAFAGRLLPGNPFDRLIAAQALAEGLLVVTRDPHFAAFGCKVLW